MYSVVFPHWRVDMTLVSRLLCSSTVWRSTSLTSQLSGDSLERQLSELFDQRSELGAADQLVFTVVQLVHRHHAIA